MPGVRSLLARAPNNLKRVDPNADFFNARGLAYPIQTWYFVATFIGLVTLYRIGEFIVHWRRKRAGLTQTQTQSSPQEDGEKAATNSRQNGISLRRLPLTFVNCFRILAYRITVPIGGGKTLNFTEIIIPIGYISALITWEWINCMNITTKAKFDSEYWSDRASNIVAIQLPLIISLSAKNNIISFLTGISYEKLNILHRTAARICLVLIYIHVAGRVNVGLFGDPDALYYPGTRTGIAMGTSYSLLIIISLRPLRTRFYEFFFFSHVLLIMFILIGGYFHVRNGTGFGPYLFPSFVFWGLDRALRGLRVLWNNRSSTPASRMPFSSDATAELLSPTMVRIVLRRKMTWLAGQNAFITMPGVSRVPFEAHPFTIASIPQSLKAGPPDGEVEKGSERSEGNELVFLIGLKEGFTKRLRNTAERHGGERTKFPVSVYVDGPYGTPPDANAFESVVLIAGGSGISYTLPLLQDIVYNARRGKTACGSVLFIWAIPHHTSISWISHALKEVLEAAPPLLKIRLRIHVTRRAQLKSDTSSRDSASDTKEDVDSIKDRLLEDKRMRVENGRPNVHDMLEEEVPDAKGHVYVAVAGPSGLAADVRKTLRCGLAGPKAVLRGSPDVTLHVETYGIA